MENQKKAKQNKYDFSSSKIRITTKKMVEDLKNVLAYKTEADVMEDAVNAFYQNHKVRIELINRIKEKAQEIKNTL